MRGRKKCLQNYPKYLDGRTQIGGLCLYGMIILIILIILISDLKKIWFEVVNWTKPVQDRLRKSVLLNTGVTFRVPKGVQNILTS